MEIWYSQTEMFSDFPDYKANIWNPQIDDFHAEMNLFSMTFTISGIFSVSILMSQTSHTLVHLPVNPTAKD